MSICGLDFGTSNTALGTMLISVPRSVSAGTPGRFSMPDMHSARVRRRSWNLRGLLSTVIWGDATSLEGW